MSLCKVSLLCVRLHHFWKITASCQIDASSFHCGQEKTQKGFFRWIVPKFGAQFLKSVTFFIVFSSLESSLDIKTAKCFTSGRIRVGKLLVSLSNTVVRSHPSVRLSVCPSIYLSVCPSIPQSIRPSLRPSKQASVGLVGESGGNADRNPTPPPGSVLS